MIVHLLEGELHPDTVLFSIRQLSLGKQSP